MTSDITFTDAGFSFNYNGTLIRIHTVVADGQAARVVVEEVQPEPITEEEQ